MFGNVAVVSTVVTHCQSVHMTREVSQLVIIACTCTCWSCAGSDQGLTSMPYFCLLFGRCHSSCFLPAEHYSLPLLVLFPSPLISYARLNNIYLDGDILPCLLLVIYACCA